MSSRERGAHAGTPLRVGPEVRERVRWRDLDMMGIVYHANYSRFIEAAETEFFRAIGWTYDAIADRLGVWIARVRFECEYRAPAKLDDELVTTATLEKIGGSSLTFAFRVERDDGTLLVAATLVLAAVDRTTLRATRVPEPLRAALGGR